jgi:hypothetical protein
MSNPIITHPAVEKITEGLQAQIDAIGLDVATSFTLADAIREGASVTRKLSGGWIEDGASCAIGAGVLSATARGYLT